MAGSWKQDRLALQGLLGEEPEAQARYGKLADYQRQMCFQWIADAPTPVLREQRICRLARRLWLTSFDPYYDIGPDLMLPELDDMYGPPRLLHHISPEEQTLALEERRVLGANHYRNYDDAGTWFRIVPPGEKHLDDLLLAYERPCVLTERTVEWLNRNGWETMRDVREWMDLPEDDRPPAPPAEPLRIEDPTAGELRPESERHAGPVLDVAVASAGGPAVSASSDGTLRVWDVETGRPTRVLAGHSGPVPAVVLTGDGRTAISASNDGTLRVWDIETGQPRARFTGHKGEVSALALMPNGQGVVSGASDGVVCVWTLPPKSGTIVLQGHTGPVLDVAVTPDGARVVSASEDGTLRAWDLSTGQTQHVLAGHTGAVLGVALTPDGQRAVSASDDGTLRVWNLATRRTRAILLGHGAAVRSVALLPDGHRVISTSDDSTMRVWHVAGSLQHILAWHSRAVAGVGVARQGWPGRFVYLSPGSLVLVTGVEPPSDKLSAISASRDGTLRLWDLKTGKNPLVLTAGVPFTSCATGPDGRTFAAGDEQGQVHFVRLRDA